MQLTSKFSKRLKFSLCLIDIYFKFGWVIPLKDKKGITTTNVFQKILDESTANQIKYGYIKPDNFAIDERNHG